MHSSRGNYGERGRGGYGDRGRGSYGEHGRGGYGERGRGGYGERGRGGPGERGRGGPGRGAFGERGRGGFGERGRGGFGERGRGGFGEHGRGGFGEHGRGGFGEHGRGGFGEHGRGGFGERGRGGFGERGRGRPGEHGRGGFGEYGRWGPEEHGRSGPGEHDSGGFGERGSGGFGERGSGGFGERGSGGFGERGRSGPGERGRGGFGERGRGGFGERGRGGFGERGRGGFGPTAQGGPRFPPPTSNQYPGSSALSTDVSHNSESSEEPKPVLITANTRSQVAAQVGQAQSHTSATRMLPPGIEAPGPRPAVPIESQEYRAWYEKWYLYSQATGDMSYEEIQTTTASTVDTTSNYSSWSGTYGQQDAAAATTQADTSQSFQTKTSSNSGFVSRDPSANDHPPNMPPAGEYDAIMPGPAHMSSSQHEVNLNQYCEHGDYSSAPDSHESQRHVMSSREISDNSYGLSKHNKETLSLRDARDQGDTLQGTKAGFSGRDGDQSRDGHRRFEDGYSQQSQSEFPRGFRGGGDGDHMSKEYEWGEEYYSKDYQEGNEVYEEQYEQSAENYDASNLHSAPTQPNSGVVPLMSMSFDKGSNRNVGPQDTVRSNTTKQPPGSDRVGTSRQDSASYSQVDMPREERHRSTSLAHGGSKSRANEPVGDRVDLSVQRDFADREHFNASHQFDNHESRFQEKGNVHGGNNAPPVENRFPSVKSEPAPKAAEPSRSSSSQKSDTNLMMTFMMGPESEPDQSTIDDLMGAAMKNNPALVQGIMTKMSSGKMDPDSMNDAMNQIMMTAMMGKKRSISASKSNSNEHLGKMGGHPPSSMSGNNSEEHFGISNPNMRPQVDHSSQSRAVSTIMRDGADQSSFQNAGSHKDGSAANMQMMMMNMQNSMKAAMGSNSGIMNSGKNQMNAMDTQVGPSSIIRGPNMLNNANTQMGNMASNMNPQMPMTNNMNAPMNNGSSNTPTNINAQVGNVGSNMNASMGKNMAVMGNMMNNRMNPQMVSGSNMLPGGNMQMGMLGNMSNNMPMPMKVSNVNQMGNTMANFNPQLGVMGHQMGNQFQNATQEGPPMKKMRGLGPDPSMNMGQALGSSGNGSQFGQMSLPGMVNTAEKTNLLLVDQIKKAKKAGLDLSQMLVCCQICDNMWGERTHPILEYIQDHVDSREHTKAMIGWLQSHPNKRYQKMLSIPPPNSSSGKKHSLEDNLKGACFCEICEVPAGYSKKECKKHLKSDSHVRRLLKVVAQLKSPAARNRSGKPTELKDVEYILVTQRLPKLTRDKNRFKTFPCQTCAVAANDVAELGFDNWIEHMATQFHMSILYDWMARCKAPAALPYRNVLNFKPYEIKEKEEPHFFCEICSKRVPHVDALIDKHMNSDKHKKKYYELKQQIEEALSGGPVTRILPEEDPMDTYPADLDLDWRHPDDIRKSEADRTKRMLEEEQRRVIEEKIKQQREAQKQMQMQQQHQLQQRQQAQHAREQELRELKQKEMQLLKEQREKKMISDKDFEDEQCRLMLEQHKREQEQQLPQNAPLQFSNNQQQPVNQQNMLINPQQMPMNGQRMPMAGQRMPMAGQRMPMAGQRMPLNAQRMMMNNQQMPMNPQRMRMNLQQFQMNPQRMQLNQQMPMNPQQRMMNAQQMMGSQQRMQMNQQRPMNPMQMVQHQRMPMDQMRPMRQQQMVPNQQRMPFNQQMNQNRQPAPNNPMQGNLSAGMQRQDDKMSPTKPKTEEHGGKPTAHEDSSKPQSRPRKKSKLEPELAKVPNPNTALLRELNINFMKQLTGGEAGEEDPAEGDESTNKGDDKQGKSSDTENSGTTAQVSEKKKPKPKDRTPRNRARDTYVLFHQRVDILATLSEFPNDAYCELCPDTPFFDNIIEWAAHVNTIPHMQALFALAFAKEGRAGEELNSSLTLPLRNHAQNMYGICETCVILNSEQNMRLHITAKRHITVLKNLANTMKGTAGWMQQTMLKNKHDFWNIPVIKRPPVASGNPVLIKAAPSTIKRGDSRAQYDATTGSSTDTLFDMEDPQIGFLHAVLTGVVSISSYKKMKETQSVPPHIEAKANEEQRSMIVKMCTTTGHLVISIARRVMENELKAKILEYYPEVNPQLIDIIAGLQPEILKLIASTPILDSPPPM